MWSPCEMHGLLILAVFYFPAMVLAAGKGKLHRPFNNSLTAIFVFGDSTVDAGNNNNVMTVLKSNFRPYGIDFPNKKATGRFSNGRLVTDLIAAYTGLKEYVPAYAQTNLSIEELMTGVSFASGGSGFDVRTSNSLGVITIKKQVENFRELTTKLAKKLGKKKTKSLIEKSVFVVSAGSNDIFIGLYSSMFRTDERVDRFLNKMVEYAKEFLHDLRKAGARNIAVVGLSKIGCAPAVVTVNPGEGGMFERNCNESMSADAMKFNKKFVKAIDEIQSDNFRIFYVDTYKPMVEMVKDPSKFGFENIDKGCCGSGLLEMTMLCNPVSYICPDRSKYIFFDSVHPSEAAYKNIFKALRPTIDEAINFFS
ncbi:GDSL esterase/lipase At5g45960-like [Salvia splendens]|uniref:GDSL esterase/lipase At5g45960-like n=1 Tax=Salvia splendens TaxID=180675 RepID=UPI001C279954|nr:GDSL esterase/lipase At5g45960-like [Salvia splendens]